MPIFACSECGYIDNTALTTAWERLERDDPLLCSLCEFGKWHGVFPRRKPYVDEMEDSRGFLQRKPRAQEKK